MTRTRVMVWSLLLTVGLIAVAGTVLWAQPAGGGGAMQDRMYLDRAWTAVSFGLNATADQLDKLRPSFQTAWTTRMDAMKKVMAAPQGERRAAMQAAGPVLTQIKTDLEAKLKEVLTPEQFTALQALTTPPQGGRNRQGGGGGGQAAGQ